MSGFLGVDGGATQNKAAVINERGQVLGEGEGEGANYHVVGISGIKKNLQASVLQALQKSNIERPLSFAVFGLAGCDSPNDQRILRELLSRDFADYFRGVLVVNDTRVALRSGTEDSYGVAVIAGTGSNIFGKNRAGTEASAGGLDYILADEGSAYSIGLFALKTAARSFDGRGPKSLLEAMVLEKLGVASMRKAVDKVYQPSFGKAEIGLFAPLVDQAADLGDTKAQEILKDSGHELFLGVRAVVGKLGMIKESFDVVLVGSVFKSRIVLDQFQKEVRDYVPGARFVFPKVPPSQAAALIAKEEYAKMNWR